MFCQNCGNNVGGAPFCNRCGARVNGQQQNQSWGNPPPSYAPPSYVPPAPLESFNLFSAYKSMFKKYGTFSGRSRRQEYWLATLANYILIMIWYLFVGIFISNLLRPSYYGDYYQSVRSAENMLIFMIVVIAIYGLVILVPSLALTVRRLHDTGRSGAWCFISLVPYVGAIILFVFTCLDGTPGPNQYGPDPKGRDGVYYR